MPTLAPQPYLLLVGGEAVGARFAGSALFSLSASGDLRIPATFAGSATLTLTGSASLAQVAASFAGHATLTLTGAGSLRAGLGAEFAGSAFLTLTASGGLIVTDVGTSLAGHAALTLTGSGALSPTAARFAGYGLLELRGAGALLADPAFRVLREDTIQRPVGRVEQTAPTAAPLDVLRFTLDSSLDTPADGWTAEVAGAALMLAPDDDALYRLPMGFLDEVGHEVLASQITQGRILDRRLVGRVTERRTYVRGLDALERTFRIQRNVRYVATGGDVLTMGSSVTVLQTALSARQAELQTIQSSPEWPTPDLETRADVLHGMILNLESGLQDATADEVPQKVGDWTAKQIAADLLVGTGLTLSWEARDWRLAEAFDATGTLYDLLRRLVEPWNQVPPFGVDVTAVGNVIRVRPRLVRPPADLTMTMAESRLVDLELGDRRRMPLIGPVFLEGRLERTGVLSGVSRDSVAPPIGLMTSSEVDVPYASPSYDGLGNEVARVEGVRTYRMPDKILIRHFERVWSRAPSGLMTQTKEEFTEIEYEDSRYGPHGPVVQPLPLSASKSIKTMIVQPGSDPPTMVLAEMQREKVVWKYDDRRFLETTTTRIFKRVDSPIEGGGTLTSFPELELIVETRTRKVDGWLELRTARTTFDPTTGKATGSATQQMQDQAGLPPGGSRPPFFWSYAGPGEDTPEGGAVLPVRVRATISTDPTAIPVRYSNRNLTRYDLEYILGQCREASGLVEYPLRGRGPALPDVTKGSAIHLTEYRDADGTPIPLEPALVRSIAFTYVDQRDQAEFSCALDAVFYRVE